MNMIKDENDLIKFAKGYGMLNKESKDIIDFLRNNNDDHLFIGSQTELMESCGRKVVRYYQSDKGKSSTNLGQFRRLGIIQLYENGVISFDKIEKKKAYTFKLNDNWVETISNFTKVKK